MLWSFCRHQCWWQQNQPVLHALEFLLQKWPMQLLRRQSMSLVLCRRRCLWDLFVVMSLDQKNMFFFTLKKHGPWGSRPSANNTLRLSDTTWPWVEVKPNPFICENWYVLRLSIKICLKEDNNKTQIDWICAHHCKIQNLCTVTYFPWKLCYFHGFVTNLSLIWFKLGREEGCPEPWYLQENTFDLCLIVCLIWFHWFQGSRKRDVRGGDAIVGKRNWKKCSEGWNEIASQFDQKLQEATKLNPLFFPQNTMDQNAFLFFWSN